MAPYVHQAYIGLYQTHMGLKQPQAARKALMKGLEWVYQWQDKKQFKAKLYRLKSV